MKKTQQQFTFIHFVVDDPVICITHNKGAVHTSVTYSKWNMSEKDKSPKYSDPFQPLYRRKALFFLKKLNRTERTFQSLEKKQGISRKFSHQSSLTLVYIYQSCFKQDSSCFTRRQAGSTLLLFLKFNSNFFDLQCLYSLKAFEVEVRFLIKS